MTSENSQIEGGRRIAWLYISTAFLARMLQARSEPVTYRVAGHGLPEDAEIIQATCHPISSGTIALLVTSSHFPVVPGNADIPVLPPCELRLTRPLKPDPLLRDVPSDFERVITAEKRRSEFYRRLDSYRAVDPQGPVPVNMLKQILLAMPDWEGVYVDD